MIKFLFKSLFLYLVLSLLLALTCLIVIGLGKLFESNITLIIVFSSIIVLLVWLFTKAIKAIAQSISFMYWLFCFAVAFLTLHFSLNKTLDLPIFVLHLAGLMFLIPEMVGTTTTYLNTRTVYVVATGEVVSETQWTSESYTPGCIRKLVTMLAIAGIFSLLEYFLGTTIIWIIFAIEAVYTVALMIINVKNFFFS